MKILLMSVGTRGDIEPFLFVGELLEKNSFDVTYAFPEQFKELLSEHQSFFSLTGKFLELIESEEGKAIMGGASTFSKLKSLFILYRKGKLVNELLVKDQKKILDQLNPDVVLFNSKCSFPLIWCLANRKIRIMLSPVPNFLYEVNGYPHIGFKHDLGGLGNRLTYRLANWGLIKTFVDSQKSLQEKAKYDKSDVKNALFTTRIWYMVSKALMNKQQNWPGHAEIVGYGFRNKSHHWSPERQLDLFLSTREKVLFLTFGSMVNSSPLKNSEFIFETLVQLGIPAVVNVASGGLQKLEKYSKSDQFYFVDEIPYSWILKRCSAVIHHGGSGTTHQVLYHGLPSLIIPHILDQFAWNKLVCDLGVGPKGPSIKQLRKSDLGSLIRDLHENDTYQLNAKRISDRMKENSTSQHVLESLQYEIKSHLM